MKKVDIKIGNEVFPCRQTMGAMIRFKQETGREVTEIDATSFTDICTFLWCCIVSASKADGKKFKLSLMDFADSVSPEDMNEWAKAMGQANEEDAETDADEKKSLQ